MESVKEHLNYLPDYFGPSKDHRIDLHEIMNFDDLRSFFWFCPVFRILLNCTFFEKRKNRSYPTIDHFFPLLSPPPHGNMFEISVRRIFEIPHRSLELFFAFFWRNFRKDYSRTNRARSRAMAKKKEKFLKNWDISKTKRAMIIIFLIIKTSDFFWISDKKLCQKNIFSLL